MTQPDLHATTKQAALSRVLQLCFLCLKTPFEHHEDLQLSVRETLLGILFPVYRGIVVKEDKFAPHFLVIVILITRFSLFFLFLPNGECQVHLMGVSILIVFQTYLVLLISFTDTLKCSFETHF